MKDLENLNEMEPMNGEEAQITERLDTQSKGFETLMNEEIAKAKNEIKGKKKHLAAIKKKKEEKKKKDFFEKESASCVQFCIWNCKENNRCGQLLKFYNQYMSRSSRWILMIMSWFMFLALTGYLLQGKGTVSYLLLWILIPPLVVCCPEILEDRVVC